MDVALQGSSPSTVVAGIMLLTRARQLGFRVDVSIVGDPDTMTRVPGPAVVYAPVLASCGVGRELGSGATVVVPGPPGDPVLATLTPHGVGGWFLVDRTGAGMHPATQAFVRLSTDARTPARALGRDVRRGLEALGCAPDPAVLDVLFGAPVPPLLRVAVALRAGRAMHGGRGTSITRLLSGPVEQARDPIAADQATADVLRQLREGDLRWISDRLSTSVRDRAQDWIDTALALADEDHGRDLELLRAVVELASHLTQLPVASILPPLGAAEDSVAVGLQNALRAEGDGDANGQLAQVFRFLGGRFVHHDPHAVTVSSAPSPTDEDDHVALWQWFCAEVRRGRKRADALWEEVFDPAS